jgi:G:T-mismatch repair DNA endonuclease (very short patch repair protein)
LKNTGWKVIHIWECEIKTQDLFLHRTDELLKEIAAGI